MISRPWWLHSGSWRRPGTSRDVRGLRLDGYKEILLRTSPKPIQKPLVSRRREAYESVHAAVDALDLEFLARLDLILSTELSPGQEA